MSHLQDCLLESTTTLPRTKKSIQSEKNSLHEQILAWVVIYILYCNTYHSTRLINTWRLVGSQVNAELFSHFNLVAKGPHPLSDFGVISARIARRRPILALITLWVWPIHWVTGKLIVGRPLLLGDEGPLTYIKHI